MSRRAASALLAACGALVACHEVTELPAPDLGDAQAALLVFMVGEAIVRVEAVDLRGGDLPPVSRAADTTVEVHALTYLCGLEALGLTAGPVTVLDIALDDPELT